MTFEPKDENGNCSNDFYTPTEYEFLINGYRLKYRDEEIKGGDSFELYGFVEGLTVRDGKLYLGEKCVGAFSFGLYYETDLDRQKYSISFPDRDIWRTVSDQHIYRSSDRYNYHAPGLAEKRFAIDGLSSTSLGELAVHGNAFYKNGTVSQDNLIAKLQGTNIVLYPEALAGIRGCW